MQVKPARNFFAIMPAMNPDKKDNLNEKAYAFVTNLLTRGELKPG